MDRNSFLGPEFYEPERNTGLRYSLANESIGRTDHIVEHPTGKVRLIHYPNPGIFRLRLRDKLIQKDLVLGAQLSQNSHFEQAFRIPLSARPIAYDADSNVKGNYSYDDTKLFRDVGRILGKVAAIDAAGSYVVNGKLGSALAIVEFARPGEQQLLLVPGTETLMYPTRNMAETLDYYLQNLHGEFGSRFGREKMVVNFQEAFVKTVGQDITPQERRDD